MSLPPPRRVAGASIANQSMVNRPANIEETIFNVRRGPDYKKNGIKAPSGPPLFKTVAIDIFRSSRKIDHVSRLVQLPAIPDEVRVPVNGVPPLFVMCVQLPTFEPANPLWGEARTDGPSYNVVVYTCILPETHAALANLATAKPAVRLLQRFIKDDSVRDRFKAMANFLNASECELGYAVRKLLVEYNMKPVLTRPQHRFYTDRKTYFEVNIDVHEFGYIARKGFVSIKSVISSMIWDVGFIIEGHSDDELPENILTVAFMSHVELDKTGHDIDIDAELRHADAREKMEKAAAVQSAQAKQATPVTQPLQPQVAIEPKQQAGSRSTSPTNSISSINIGVPPSAGLLAATPKEEAEIEFDDEIFHDADEEFYDAE